MFKRVRVVYSGRVQGVGFRFTVLKLAEGLGVTGWVKNFPDGKVEITVEGDESKLHSFLGSVREHFENYIKGVDLSWLSATGEFSGFNIRH